MKLGLAPTTPRALMGQTLQGLPVRSRSLSTLAATTVAFVVTLLLAPLTLVALRRRQLLAIPNARSSHDVPLPRGLGVALSIGGTVGLLLARDLGGHIQPA